MLKSKIISRIIFLGVLILLIFNCGCSAGGEDDVTLPSDTGTTPAETTTPPAALIESTSVETTIFESPYPFPQIEPMPDELRISVEKIYISNTKWDIFPGWENPENPMGLRYYGTFENIVVLFDRGQMSAQIQRTEVIADRTFVFHTSFALYACDGKELIKLSDAYEHGLISKETIGIVADIHNQFNMWRDPHLYG